MSAGFPANSGAGRVVAHGIDLVEFARFERALAAHPERFAQRVFTPAEVAYADESPARRVERLAARFAAKEAVFKAIGTGWSGGVGWTDASVIREPGGRPRLIVAGEAQRVAASLGIGAWLVSLSHSGGYAMASVLGVAGEGAG